MLFSDLDRAVDTLDKLISYNWGVSTTFQPPVEVLSEDGSYVLAFDVPGVEEKDVEVTVKNRILTVTGERKSNQTKTYSECMHGKFKRSFTLPVTCDDNLVSAKLSNGVLIVTIGHRPETKPKRIEVRSGV